MNFFRDYKIIIVTIIILSVIYGFYRYQEGNPQINVPISNQTVPIEKKSEKPITIPKSVEKPRSSATTKKQGLIAETKLQSSAPTISNLDNPAKYLNSVVQLRCQNTLNSDQTIAGSGVIISNNGYILTSKHLLLGYDKPSRSFYVGLSCDVRMTRSEDLASSVFLYKATAVRILNDYDVAILRIVQDNKGNTVEPPFHFNPLTPSEILPTPGDKVYAIGYPDTTGLNFDITSGNIEGYLNVKEKDMIKINAPLSGGNSGGALLDANGQFVGIPTAIDTGTSGSMLGLALKTHDIARWVNSVIQNLNNLFLTSRDFLERKVEFENNPYPIVSVYFNNALNKRFVVVNGHGFCDNNPGTSDINVGGYQIISQDIVSWSDSRVDFFLPTSMPTAIYGVTVRGYKADTGFCPKIEVGGITIQ